MAVVQSWHSNTTQAFDCVDNNILWKGLRYLEVPEHLIILMERLYEPQQATVRTDFGETEPFLIGKGVRQGCTYTTTIPV